MMEQRSFKIRASARTAWGLHSIFVLMFVLAVVDFIKKYDYKHVDLGMFLLSLGPLVVLRLWVRAFKVEVQNGLLRYSTLFSRTRSVRFEDILSIKNEVDFHDDFGPPFRLKIRYRDGASVRTMKINIRVFRLEDVKRLEAILQARA